MEAVWQTVRQVHSVEATPPPVQLWRSPRKAAALEQLVQAAAEAATPSCPTPASPTASSLKARAGEHGGEPSPQGRWPRAQTRAAQHTTELNARLHKTYTCIEKQSRRRGETTVIAPGQLVMLAVPPQLCAAADPKTLVCMVLLRARNNHYFLRCKAGVLETPQPGDNMTAAPPGEPCGGWASILATGSLGGATAAGCLV